MKTVERQVIVKDGGNSWFGFWTSNKKFNEALTHILELSKDERYKSGKWANAFWILDSDGACVAAQSSKEGALRHYNPDRVLVHYQSLFVTY